MDIKLQGKSPCLNCTDRQPGCHSICEKYKEWKRAAAIKDEAIRTARKMDNRDMRQELLAPSKKNRIERSKRK